MTRDEMEAAVWRAGRRLTAAQVDQILRAADEYAAEVSAAASAKRLPPTVVIADPAPVTSARRRVLYAETTPHPNRVKK
jgi:hypothetical protein